MNKKPRDFLKSLLSFRLSDTQGQHIMEYTLVITLVVAAVVTMGPYVIRAWNANLQGWDDSIEDSYKDPLMEADKDIQLPYCECSDWNAVACGGGPCDGLHMFYKRNCTPPGCSNDEKCECDPTCCIYYDPGECGPYADPPCPPGERRMMEDCGCNPTITQSVCRPDPACVHQCLNPFPNECGGAKYGDYCTGDTVGLPFSMNWVAVDPGACTAGQKCEQQCVYPFEADTNGALCVCPGYYTDQLVACECLCDYTRGWVEQEGCGGGRCEQGPCAGSRCTNGPTAGW